MAEKITQIGILVEESLKKDFQATCKAQDKNASQEIRALMREYVKKHRIKKVPDLLAGQQSEDIQQDAWDSVKPVGREEI
ncbi:hypothetical protein EHF38_19205 (plasmid) [Acinetobacter baumannii]|uniref:hypothetical protein n=1 Tax=Acinetobacter baumannii TaxID=470 RepID=UPI000FEC876C|nr:hypothetical protein [Acinetobacter baumannii]MCV2392575.1 hypothetical protein [Acinetobacter baumannii]QAB42491.1 hypothetical protein EHF38_19205 [Acinetobacter baumannii]